MIIQMVKEPLVVPEASREELDVLSVSKVVSTEYAPARVVSEEVGMEASGSEMRILGLTVPLEGTQGR